LVATDPTVLLPFLRAIGAINALIKCQQAVVARLDIVPCTLGTLVSRSVPPRFSTSACFGIEPSAISDTVTPSHYAALLHCRTVFEWES